MSSPRVEVSSASSIGFEAKHHSNSFRSDRGDYLLDRTEKTVREFAQQGDEPVELRLAATSVWLAVRAANLADLFRPSGNPYKANKPYMKSPEGWGLHVITRGGDSRAELPDTIGFVFTREGQETVDHSGQTYSTNPRTNARLIRSLDREAPRFTDAYVWLQPEARGEGIAAGALESVIPHIEATDVRVPFDIDPANGPAQRLIGQYVAQEQVAA